MRLLRHAALLMLLLAAGCRTGTPEFRSAYPAKELKAKGPAIAAEADIARVLGERTRAHPELRASGDVTIRREGVRGKGYFGALVLYQEPGNFRLRASRVPIGTIFEVLIRGDEALLNFNTEGRMFVGSLADLQSKMAAIGGLSPRDFISAATAQQELLRALQRKAGIADAGDHWIVAARHEASRRQMIWMLRKSDGLVRELLVRSPEGAEELRIRYDAYSLFESGDPPFAEPMPTAFRIAIPADGTTVDVDIDEYLLEPALKPKMFEPPKADEIYALRELQFEESP